MSHITRIAASGFKRHPRFAYDLSPNTLITGPNFLGKSSIVEAAVVAVLGHLPQLGEKNASTFELCSGDELSVTLSLSDGAVLSRSWKRSASGVSQKKNVPSAYENADIPLLTPGAYFKMTESERIGYVFSRVTMPDGYAPERIFAEIEAAGDSEDVTTDDEEAVSEIVTWAREAVEQYTSTAAALMYLTEDKLPSEYTTYNRRQRASKGAVEKANEIMAHSEETQPSRIKALEAQQQALAKENQEIAGELGKLEAQAQAAAKQLQRRVQIEMEIAAPMRDFDKEIAAAKEELSKYDGRVITDARQKRITLIAKQSNVVEKRDSLKADAAQRLRDSRRCQERIEQLVTLDLCPECVAKLIVPLQKENTEYVELFSACSEEAAQVQTEVDSLDVLIAELFHVAAKEDRDDTEIKELTASIEDLERAKGIELEDRARLRAELERMAPPAEVNHVRVSELHMRQQAINVDTTTLRSTLRDAYALREQLAMAEKCLKDHRREKAFATVIERAKKNLIRLQGEMLSKVFGDLIAKANAILGDLLPTPLCYFEGRIGRMENGRFIGFRTFSESEQALASVSIAAAFSQCSALPVLILDEMGRMAPTLQGRVLKRLSECVDNGTLSQVIGVIPRDTPVQANNVWNVIAL